jgi:hypothetical protein
MTAENVAAALPSVTPTVLPNDLTKAGEDGKGGIPQITNVEFIDAVFQYIPEGAFAAACSFDGDPGTRKSWPCQRADLKTTSLVPECNNYINGATFYPGKDGTFKARKANFAVCHFLMLDDLGTKVAIDRLDKFELSWLIETSPGNHQGGIILAEPLTDGDQAARLLKAIMDSGLCDEGAGGAQTRWARLPVAINGKPKHVGKDDTPFQCRLVEWEPDKRYTPQEIVDRLELDLAPAGRPKKASKPARGQRIGNASDDVLTPKTAENPVVLALKAQGFYKTPLGTGKHDVTCPWVKEHTDAIDHGTVYFEPDERYPVGGFKCQLFDVSAYGTN